MFIDAQFPVDISKGSGGGPQYKTSVISMYSGGETRNIGWTYPRHNFDAALGIRTRAHLESVIAFFHVVKGRAHTFRWKDWADYKSCSVNSTKAATDQALGTGDGVEDEFQLVKNYTFGATTVSRKIVTPVSGTTVIALNGVATDAFTVDTDTGIVTMNAAPGLAVVITAGYEFDVPCRLDTDEMSTSLEAYTAEMTTLPIIEVKNE